MKRIRRIALSLVLAVALTVMFVVPVAATNPTVSITVQAGIVAITNSQDTWAIGVVSVNDVKYFSADNDQDDDYSKITNTGNVAVDIELQGEDFEGGDYDWTLAAATASETYSLYAISGNGTGTYTTEVKSSAFTDLTTDLAVDAIWYWSMNFTAPTAFHASDDGVTKNATLTLVATQH